MTEVIKNEINIYLFFIKQGNYDIDRHINANSLEISKI